MNEKTIEKPTKIFISHSSRDVIFVQPLVELFEHIGLSPENIFCSSVTGYKIPLGTNIYSYLKEQFQNYDLRIIFILSENYYQSPACLNEMGAAWVLQHKYTSILLPGFNFRDIKGVIDQMQISIKLDSEKSELKSRLNELRDTLIKEFKLNTNLCLSSQNIWERHRDAFVNKVNSIEIYWKDLHQLKENNEPITDWILPLQKLREISPTNYDATYLLGTIYAKINDLDNAIKYLNMTIKFSENTELQEKAKKRLQQLGYFI